MQSKALQLPKEAPNILKPLLRNCFTVDLNACNALLQPRPIINLTDYPETSNVQIIWYT